MSDYRDDTQETAVASDSAWLGLTAVAEEVVTATATLMFGLMVLHADTAAASDEVFDSAGHLLTEIAVASDQLLDGRTTADLVLEAAAASDLHIGVLRVLHSDTATATDVVLDSRRESVSEVASAADLVLDRRYVPSLVEDRAAALDFTGTFAAVLVEESLAAEDWASGTARMRSVVGESVTVADEFLGSHLAVAPALTETAAAAGLVLDRLHAVQLVVEIIDAEDAMLGDVPGQAWTANADSWAMSRYAPYTFESLAVINGALYGVADGGVYALDGGAGEVEARIKTGMLDLGKGGLVHPTQAFIEYELEGGASLAVTTTQSGAEQTYIYSLEYERGAYLTSGQFKFGRGLRGRHFAFELSLQATRAKINDLRVDSAPTNRRV